MIMLTSHHFHPSVVREYDMRGRVEETLFEADAYAIGLCFGTIVRKENVGSIIVGYDGRLSSPALTAALIDGLTQTGLNVIDVGMGPSPLIHFATFHLDVDASIMVTGSHNPSAYNGFKFTLHKKPFFGSALRKMARMAERGDWVIQDTKGSIAHRDIKNDYVDRLLMDCAPITTMRVIWDAGNGATATVLKQLTDTMGGTHTRLFDTVDGHFPHHHPDPSTAKNLVDVITAVQNTQADVGFAFDGDGDRIGVIDPTGRVIWPDELMAIFAADILKDHPGATIIGDVKCSTLLFNEVKRLGGKPVIWKTGHSHVKSKMIEENAPLAGELSGHIFFKDKFYGFDDALYAAVRLIDIMVRSGKSLCDLTAHFEKMTNTPEIRFAVSDDNKFELIENLRRHFSTLPDYTLNTVDGVRLENDKGWLLIRASNTENALSARIEAVNDNALMHFKHLLKTQLHHHMAGSGYAVPAELD